MRIEKSLFLLPFDLLSVCVCEYPIHRRSPRRLFIASSITASPHTNSQAFSTSTNILLSPIRDRLRVLPSLASALQPKLLSSIAVTKCRDHYLSNSFTAYQPILLSSQIPLLSNITHRPYQSLAMHFQSDFQSRAMNSSGRLSLKDPNCCTPRSELVLSRQYYIS